ncbi:MAG: NADPH-dependent FMN reductase, partial [Achromobacter spanius]
MSTYKIAVFVGSLRAASINLRLARALEKLVPADFKFEYVSLGDIPLYNQDNENNLP